MFRGADQRYYNSAAGRFLSPDPYQASGGPADPQSWNRYPYVQNDPVNFHDPSGLYLSMPDGPGGGGGGFGGFGGFLGPSPFDQPFLPGPPPVALDGGGGGGGGATNYLASALQASLKRLIDRLDDDCAAAIGAKDSADAISRLEDKKTGIGFAPLGTLSWVTGKNGTIESGGGPVGRYNPFTGSIRLNAQVNWKDPNDTLAMKDGRAFTYRALDAQAAALGVASVTAEQFMDLTIIHEMAHAIRKVDPDVLANDKKIWNDCFKW